MEKMAYLPKNIDICKVFIENVEEKFKKPGLSRIVVKAKFLAVMKAEVYLDVRRAKREVLLKTIQRKPIDIVLDAYEATVGIGIIIQIHESKWL